MDPSLQISSPGACVALVLAIVLIIRKVPACYALIFGAFVGGLWGYVELNDIGVGRAVVLTVKQMVVGAQGIMPAVLRVLSAGVLAGVLIRSGAAERIALSIMGFLGKRHAVLALILSCALLTFAGVFIDIAVLTVAPVALAVAQRGGYSRIGTLFALIGGGKSGNVISANPNSIIAAENYNVALPDMMLANIPAALAGIVATLLVSDWLIKKGERVVAAAQVEETKNLPSFFTAVIGPVVAVGLLFLRPTFGIEIDPLIALPVGGIVGLLAMRRARAFNDYVGFGLEKMSVVAVLLIGTGALAGIIQASTLKDLILHGMETFGLSAVLIAPISAALMSGATASTTAGATIASATFAQTVTAAGVSAVWGAAMTNAGATVLDHLPHGSFFHVTAGSVGMDFSTRLKLIPFESLVGFILASISTACCLLFS